MLTQLRVGLDKKLNILRIYTFLESLNLFAGPLYPWGLWWGGGGGGGGLKICIFLLDHTQLQMLSKSRSKSTPPPQFLPSGPRLEISKKYGYFCIIYRSQDLTNI